MVVYAFKHRLHHWFRLSLFPNDLSSFVVVTSVYFFTFCSFYFKKPDGMVMIILQCKAKQYCVA